MKRPANPHADKTCGTCRHWKIMYRCGYCSKLSHDPPRTKDDRACRMWKKLAEKEGGR